MARDRAARPEARPLRLFIAVDVSERERERLADAVAPLKEGLGQGRWTPPENWHVTLKFLGSVWPRLGGRVRDAVREVAGAHQAFTSALARMGAFPSLSRARVLWAGLEDPAGRLTDIARDLDRVLARDFRTEARPFAPHLTIARFEPPVRLPEAVLRAAIQGGPFLVDRLVLYRSHLRRPAPRYEALEEFPLSPRAAL